MPTTLYLIVSGSSRAPSFLTIEGEWTTDTTQPFCCFANLDEAMTLCATLPNSRPIPLSYTPPRLQHTKPSSPPFSVVGGVR